MTVPRVPSTSSVGVRGDRVEPLTATTHGIASWRAMIAVWLVGPPRLVASATTSAGSRPAVSAGARSSAHRIDGSAGVGTPGSGTPTSSAMTRSRMSCRSVTRSAIRPPICGEQVDELLDRRLRGATAGAPPLICFSAAPSQARSWASEAVAASTSDAAPVACAARSRSRSATAAAAASNRPPRGPSASATSGADAADRVPGAGRAGSPGRIPRRGRPAPRSGPCRPEGRRTG